MNDLPGCLACDLTHGREPLPGGRIHETSHWLVEHCIGPLGVGTLILKPRRHVTRVSELTPEEAAEFGPLLQATASVIDAIAQPEQIYTCLWSHSGGQPVHIHWVLQPVSAELMAQHDCYGPLLQVQMFQSGVAPDPDGMARFADAARSGFARVGSAPSAGAVHPYTP